MEMSKLKPTRGSLALIVLSLFLVVLLGGGYAAWRYFDAPPLDRYAPLIAKIAAHQVEGDSRGQIDLSKAYAGLTPKDMAYITWHGDGSFLAMFPTYYGEGAEMEALLYTSRPLRDEDTHMREGSINFAEHLIGVGTYENLLLEKQINPSWYHVSYKLR
jgi:hypothetical protein